MKKYNVILIAFIIHIIIALSMRYNLLLDIENKGWHFKHGGDQIHYFKLARDISSGKLTENQFTLGYPLFLVPFIKLTYNADDYTDILNSVLLFYNFILYPLLLIMLFKIFEKISKNTQIAKFTIILYSIFPLLLYFFVGILRSFFLGGIYAGREMWLTMLSEPLTVFLCFSLIYFMTFKEKIQKKYHYALIGMIYGYLVLIKPNYLLVCVIFIPWLFDKKWKGIFIAALFAFLVYTPQLYYNNKFFGGPLKTGYQKAWKNLPGDQAQLIRKNGIFSYKNAVFLFTKISNKAKFIELFIFLSVFLWIIAVYNCTSDQIPLQLYTVTMTFFYLFYLGTYLSVTRYFSIVFPGFIFFSVLSIHKVYKWIKK